MATIRSEVLQTLAFAHLIALFSHQLHTWWLETFWGNLAIFLISFQGVGSI